MFSIREIQEKDNASVATLIRTVMPEFNCSGEGFSINDPEVDDMYNAFAYPFKNFYVVTRNSDDSILGCGGFAPLAGEEESGICELQKMYFYPELRGFGMGQKLLEKCIEEARQKGYKKMYLETVQQMKQAAKLYQKMGFEYIPEQLGNTGHSGCNLFMIREI